MGGCGRGQGGRGGAWTPGAGLTVERETRPLDLPKKHHRRGRRGVGGGGWVAQTGRDYMKCLSIYFHNILNLFFLVI